MIFVDCEPALTAVKEWKREQGTAPHWTMTRVLREQLERIRRDGHRVDLQWTPGHVSGWPESPNAAADEEAREGATESIARGQGALARICTPIGLIKSLIKSSTWEVVVQPWWTREATAGIAGRKPAGKALYAVHPDLGKRTPLAYRAERSRGDQILLDRIRLNCCVDKRHIYRMQGQVDWCEHPECARFREPDTALHRMIDCPRHDDPRCELMETLAEEGRGSDCPETMEDVIDQLKRTGQHADHVLSFLRKSGLASLFARAAIKK